MGVGVRCGAVGAGGLDGDGGGDGGVGVVVGELDVGEVEVF